MALAREYDGRVDELHRFLEDRLLSYLPDQKVDNPGPGEVAISYNWFPTIFPENQWPVQGATHLYDDGRPALGDAYKMPGVVAVGWRVHALSLLGKRTNTGAFRVTWDGRQEARDRCARVYARWRHAFLSDSMWDSAAQRVEVGRSEAGDKDRLGTFYEEITSVGTRIIWIHQCEAVIYL